MFLCLLLVLNLMSPQVFSHTDSLESLKGIPGVQVLVESIDGKQLDDADRKQIKADIEKRLKKQNIPAGDDFDAQLRVLISYFEVPANHITNVGYSCAIYISLCQNAVVSRNGQAIKVPTWENTYHFTGSFTGDSGQIKSNVIKGASDMILDFIMDFKEANPDR